VTEPFWTDGTVRIWHGSALRLPLPDGCVDLIVTSPPYFGLRAYSDGGETYSGQIGSEATPGEFVDALIAATAEMVRVLKPSGSIWVNLGDKYAQPGKGERNRNGLSSTVAQHAEAVARNVSAVGQDYGGIPGKSLMGLPWRYAIRCIDELGLILRAEVIWSKPNGLPESVTDRVRRSHETWFHFTKEPRYFTGIDEIREPQSQTPGAVAWRELRERGHDRPGATRNTGGGADNPLGKLPGSVWTIPTQPLTVPWGEGIERGCVVRYFTTEQDATAWVRLGRPGEHREALPLPDHFAAFPMEWPRRIIRGWSPSGICIECGEGRRPVAERDPIDPRFLASNSRQEAHERLAVRGVSASSILRTGLQSGQSPAMRVTGYACACDAPTAPTRPAVILDPFAGTGTVGVAARALGRNAELVDLSRDYCRLTRWRVTDPGERARALQVEKPGPVPVNADALFDMEGS
jgi:DNA modification methylase